MEAVLAQLDGVEHVRRSALPRQRRSCALTCGRVLRPAQIPTVCVWNKIDKAADPAALRARAATAALPTVCVSALTRAGMDDLWRVVQAEIERQTLVSLVCLVPFEHAQVLSRIRALGALEHEEYREDGILVTAKVPMSLAAGPLKPWRQA